MDCSHSVSGGGENSSKQGESAKRVEVAAQGVRCCATLLLSAACRLALRDRGAVIPAADFFLFALCSAVLPVAPFPSRAGSSRLSGKQLEATRRMVSRHIRKKETIWIRAFPDIPVTTKPIQIRMGKGKGAVDHWVHKVWERTLGFR